MRYNVILQEIMKDLDEISFFSDKRKSDYYRYDLPNKIHSLFIFVDDSLSDDYIVIEPNIIKDGGLVPFGDCGLCDIDKDEFIIELDSVLKKEFDGVGLIE